MTHDELLAKIDDSTDGLKHEDIFSLLIANTQALRAVVELHRPNNNNCNYCLEEQGEYMSPREVEYPCPTIEAIEKELQ